MRDESAGRELFGILEALGDGRLDPQEHERLQQLLKADSEARRTYLDYIDLHLALGKLMRRERGLPAKSGGQARPAGPSGRRTFRLASWAILGAAAAALLAVTITIAARGPGKAPPGEIEPDAGRAAHPLLTQSSGARFFGGRSLPHGSRLSIGEEYALSQGLLEVGFADGATAIIRAPAVFVAAGRARLVMKLGRCSIHAPEGAEGFRVETPIADIVDLGTRFSVDVSDTGGADVQVIEGAAEVYSGGPPEAPVPPVRLTTGQARRYAIRRDVAAEEIAFDASRYTARLPDRVVSYSATERGGDGVEELRGLTVQRGGTLHSYSPGDLIGIDLIHFRATVSTANITTATGVIDPERGDGARRDRAALLDRDADLNTGVINPGGARDPLAESPVFRDPERPGEPNTPGFAVRFRAPVINSEGPDVVFFELQVIVHPEEGDPFRVSPLRFAPGLRTHTVRSYDIDLSSPEARTLAGFRLYAFDSTARTLGELLLGRHNGGSEHRVRAKALAVGIDLSDLGYKPGAAVEGLFFQDAQDDNNLVDPVFIAGLPPVGRP